MKSKRALISIFVALLFMLTLSACSERANDAKPFVASLVPATAPQTATAAPTPPVAPTSAPQPTPTPEPPRVPVRITLDALGISADIVPMGLDAEDRMDVPGSADLVAWYMYGAGPGQNGNALLAGHIAWNKKKGKFAHIKKLNAGDTVTIAFEDGGEDAFEVISNDSYLIADVPESVMELGGEARVTMITCDGAFDQNQGTSEARSIVILHFKEVITPPTPAIAPSENAK